MQEQETIREDISNRTLAELGGFTLGKEEYLEKQLEEELRLAQEEEALLNLQSNGQEGTWAVEEARARLNKAEATQ